jgi:hypothetical protein
MLLYYGLLDLKLGNHPQKPLKMAVFKEIWNFLKALLRNPQDVASMVNFSTSSRFFN